MRAFIALDIPYEVKNFITVQLFDLKKHFDYDDIKWTNTENYHLTFVFFYDIDQNVAIDKFNALKQGLINFKASKVNILPNLGFFYNKERIRVVFLKVEPEDFFYKIHNVVSKFFNVDKFSPHITIGRVKKVLSREKEIVLKNYKLEPISFEARQIVLFKSLLNPLGPQYIKIDKFCLV